MPTYSYRCNTCGRQYEIVHGFHDVAHQGCELDGDVLVKVITTPAVKFKGGGWGGSYGDPVRDLEE